MQLQRNSNRNSRQLFKQIGQPYNRSIRKLLTSGIRVILRSSRSNNRCKSSTRLLMKPEHLPEGGILIGCPFSIKGNGYATLNFISLQMITDLRYFLFELNVCL